MIEEAVFRLFDQLAGKGADEHTAVGPALADLGWSDIEAEYPIEACELLFRAQGRSLAHTDCLSTVMLAELSPLLDGPVDGIVLPARRRLCAGLRRPTGRRNRAGAAAERRTSRRAGIGSDGHGVDRRRRRRSIVRRKAGHLRPDRVLDAGEWSDRRRPRSTRRPNGTAPSPPRTAPLRPNWSRWPTRRCASPSSTSASASNSVLPSAHSSRHGTCWPTHRRTWKAPARCWTRHGATAEVSRR